MRFLSLPRPGLRPNLPRLALATCCLLQATAVLPTAATEPRVDFSRQILPILSDKCFVCHGPDAAELGEDMRRLDSHGAATALTESGRAIDPDNPGKSLILDRIYSADDPMPPADFDKQLTDSERALLSQWINEGGNYAKHWAFVPPVKEPPENLTAVDVPGTIDAFIQRPLLEAGIDFSPEADRATLARRVALILTGLPPEPEQLSAFLNDDSTAAYEKYVDLLLASPRYGEHQARYWLDAVRYGDTHGLHLDNRRGIYPFRDWVVRAMNDNLPLDEFIRWQLAGDLLPNPTIDQLIATGFVRMNPTTAEGGAIPAEFQAKNNFDRTETLGTVLLGMSLTCARCHTHKYDPIPQTEYYRLMAFFNSTAESSMDGNKYEYGPVMKVPQDQAAWTHWKQLEDERNKIVNEAEAANPSVSDEQKKQWQAADAAARLKVVADTTGPFSDTSLQGQAAALLKRISDAEKSFTTTLIARDLPRPRVTKVLKRGEYNLPVGEPLQPGVLSVMGAMPTEAPRNRLGLSQWLTSADHPLVSRVLVNRIWQRVFGYGLVRTPEDFGVQGQQPTHPELLDWLAVELQDSHWNLKHILKSMVMTRTFRQTSAWRDDVEDPENRSFARASSYRLDAEVLRDMGLWSSNLLDPHMGGEGVKPYQPAGMWLAMAHPASNTKKYERDKGTRLYRRSLYVYWKRTSPHPMMTLFDAPDRESSCVRRSRTNTSLQSLGLLNETQRVEMARTLAERLLKEKKADNPRLDFIYSLLACRTPSALERSACLRLLASARERYEQSSANAVQLLSIGENPRDDRLPVVDLAAWTQVAATILASDAAIMLY